MSSVYLAGPIAHLTYDEANAWRVEAVRVLSDFGIRGRSPLRGKEFLQERGIITLEAYNDVMASDPGIVTRDRYDVMNCDLVLVNLLGAPKVSCGTPVEYGWADAFRKPIITVIEDEGSPYDHPFVRQLTGYRVNTLDEGLSIAKILLT